MPNDRDGFRAESDAIRTLRRKYPRTGAMTLAKKIYYRSFEIGSSDDELCRQTNGRPLYATYSVIRRFDAKQLVAA